MAQTPDSYLEEDFVPSLSGSFSPWRPSVWHLWLVAPIAAAVVIVLTFYAVL